MPDLEQYGMSGMGMGMVNPVGDPRKAVQDYELSEIEDRTQHKKLNLSEDEKKRVLKHLQSVIDKSTTDMSGKISDWDKIDRAYKGVLPPRTQPWPGASNICIRAVQNTIHKLARLLHTPLCGSRPLFPLEPREGSDVERSKRAEQFLDYDGRINMKVPETGYQLLTDTGRYGTGLVKVVYIEEYEEVTKVEVYDGRNPEHIQRFLERFPDAAFKHPDLWTRLQMGERLVLDVAFKECTYKGPRPQRIKRKDFIMPKGYTDANKAPYWFEKIKMSWWDLEDAAENEKYETDALEKIKGNHSNKDDPESHTKKEYVVYEGMYRYAANGEVREKCLFTVILDEKVVLRAIKYPYKHGRAYVVPFRYMSDEDDFDGESLGEQMLHPQKLMTMIYNLAIDSNVANYPTFVHTADQGSGRNFNRESWRPLKIWELRGTETLQQLPSTSSANNSLMLLEYAKRHSEDTSGISQYWTGGESKLDPKAPAAKTRMLLEVSQKDIQHYLQSFLVGWTEMIFQICELYSQYGTEDKEYRILNERGEPVFEAAPEDLRVRPDMEPRTTDVEFTKEGKKERLLELIVAMREDPDLQQYVPPENRLEIWNRALEIWGGGVGKIAHGLIPSRQEVLEREAMIQLLKEEKRRQLQAQAMEGRMGAPQQGGMMPMQVPSRQAGMM